MAVEAILASSLLNGAAGAGLAGAAAKGTMNMNKKGSKIKVLGNDLMNSSNKSPKKDGETKGKKTYRLSKPVEDEFLYQLVSNGMSTREAMKIMKHLNEINKGEADWIGLAQRVIWNRNHGLPLEAGCGGPIPEPPEDDDSNEEDKKPKTEKEKEEEKKLAKQLEKNAHQNRSLSKSDIQKKTDSEEWTYNNYGKRLTSPKDKMLELSPDEKAVADNKRFDEGVGKAYKEAADAAKAARNAPKNNPFFKK